ncbi:M48 family metalloprotease [Arenicella sp. 4NH20-0111]|uniref:M48 family metalloprotease n=1 Tax=Arenicella sp. 4NH20-0111 TaxID=3127648 RepID=UPI003105CCFD
MSSLRLFEGRYPGVSALCVAIFVMFIMSGATLAQSQKSRKQAEKQFLEAQAKKWPNLSGTALKRHLSVIAATPISTNKVLNDYVQEVGERVLAASPHKGRDYRFLVLDDENPNAFTMGQDYIYINRGLITLYQSEAQLAGVLGHEIGHNIGRHVSRKQGKGVRDSIFATTMSILAGSNAVGNAIATQNAANLQKYSRKLELEADRFGATYLYGSKYEPEGLVQGLGTLFDYVGLLAGKETGPRYHGIFSSHPRTDMRLRAVIREVGELPPGEADLGRGRFRDALGNVVFGPNLKPTAPPGYVRYNNETLGITFLHPEEWNRTIKGSKIIIKDPDQTLQFKIEIEKTANKTDTSDVAIKARYPDDLSDVRKINPKSTKDLGVVAMRPNQRVALIKVARNTFHFQGISRDNKLSKEVDAIFLGMIASFRRLHPNDKNLTELKRIYFEQLKPGETFGSIAADKKDENVASEPELRVINGYFPKGEAEPGTWIKKVRLVKVDQNDRKGKTADGKAVTKGSATNKP